jgi:hypothetical protein
MIRRKTLTPYRSFPSLCIGCIRELGLIICAGCLLGNLLAVFSGGFQGVQTASAASVAARQSGLRTTEIHFRMDPSDPSHLKEIQLGVQTTDGQQPEELWIKLSGSSDLFVPCRPIGSTWTCPVEDAPIVKVQTLEVLIP